MTWYVAITNPNCHRRAEAGLAAIGYRAFWPRLRRWVSHARTKKAKEYPILGRYVFVEIPDDEFGLIRTVNGIEGFVNGDNGAPAKIPASAVWSFHDRYAAGEWDFVVNQTGEFVNEDGEVVTRKNRVPNGAYVRIMEGAHADLMTVIRGRKNGKLEFLARGKWAYTHEANVRAA